MFFLKELPSKQMIEGYAEAYGVAGDSIAEGLAVMRRASLLVRRLEAYFAKHAFSQLRFLFLIVIDREPERAELSVGEIADRLDVAGPVVARTLQVLLNDGLVSSERDPNDARTKNIRLTRAGRVRLQALLPEYFSIIAEEVGEAA